MMAEGKKTIASQLFPRYVKFPELNGKTAIKLKGKVQRVPTASFFSSPFNYP